jgi:hypothetical protein
MGTEPAGFPAREEDSAPFGLAKAADVSVLGALWEQIEAQQEIRALTLRLDDDVHLCSGEFAGEHLTDRHATLYWFESDLMIDCMLGVENDHL